MVGDTEAVSVVGVKSENFGRFLEKTLDFFSLGS